MTTPRRPLNHSGRYRDRSTRPITNVSDELRRLTPRDRWILDHLAEHQVFSTEQLAALAFDNVRTARIRLGLLASRRVLTRFRDCVRPGSQSWRWTLGPVGAAYIAARDGTPMPRPAALNERRDRLAANPRLGHLLGVNGFFVELAAHARHAANARLDRWWSERRCGEVCGDLARPDGHGIWTEDGRTLPFWLEYDTGTEPTHRVIRKLDGYAAMSHAAEITYPVLIWVRSNWAENCLHVKLRTHPAIINRELTVATAYTSEHRTHPAAAVWLPANHTDRFRLAQLPTD